MRTAIIFGAALLIWILGYVKVDFEEPKGPALYRAFLRPPPLIYLLCGQPSSSKIPRGVMAVQALFAQFQGFLCLILAILSFYAQGLELRLEPAVLVVGTILNYFLALRLYHLYPYKKE
jgi:hypothetical protein